MKIKYDLHIHSCLSPCAENDMTPNNIAGMAMLGGIRVAALTDHNSVKNCPAFYDACRKYGIVPIAGMEITTAEEIHVVCLFATLEAAMEFGELVDSHRMKIKNRSDIFGQQLIMNAQDEVIGEEEYLLLSASDLDVFTVAKEVFSRGGVAYPAHIEKPTDSIIAMLGDIPKEAGFFAAEVKDLTALDALIEKYPILEGMTIVSDSDSHMLEGLVDDRRELELELLSDDENEIRDAVIRTLRGPSI